MENSAEISAWDDELAVQAATLADEVQAVEQPGNSSPIASHCFKHRPISWRAKWRMERYEINDEC